MRKNEKLINNLIGIVLIAIAIWAAVLVAVRTTGSDVWYDELFSVKLGKMSFSQIKEFTSLDVHPPLYYWYIKVFTSLLGAFDYVAMCKLASFVPYAVMFILSLTMIRKRWGVLTAGLFLVLITIMPNLAVYYVEIRMYSLVMPFLLIQGIMLSDILNEDKSLISRWIIFFICSIIVAYTQYFALVATAGLYLTLLIGIILKPENRKNRLFGFFGMVLGALVLYLPWIPSMYKQITGVVGSYWIQPLSIKSIPGCLKYIFLPENTKVGYVLAALIIALVAIIYIRDLKIKKNYGQYVIWLAGPIAIIVMVMLGFVFSFMGRPIFVYRYMIPVIPLMYLGVAYLLSCEKRWLQIVTLIVVLVIGKKTMGVFVYEENVKLSHIDHSMQVMSEIPQGSMIVANFEQVTAISAYYLKECDSYIYDEFYTDPLIKNLFEDNTYELHGEDIKTYIKDKYDNVYYFGTGHERDGYVADWEANGVKVTFLEECLIERYWINVYKLELE